MLFTNRNKRLSALTNKDYHKDDHKEIFEKIVKEKLDEIKELTHEINQNDLTYLLKVIILEKDLMITMML